MAVDDLSPFGAGLLPCFSADLRPSDMPFILGFIVAQLMTNGSCFILGLMVMEWLLGFVPRFCGVFFSPLESV